VEATLKNSQSTPAREICRSILDDVQRFACAQPLQDDITALALVRAGAS